MTLIIDEGEYLAHYGILRRSGRYPWGSGGEEIHYSEFMQTVSNLRAKGFTEKKIADALGIKTTELRARNSIAKNEKRQQDIDTAWKLHNTGMGNSAIGREMGLPESTIRNLLKPGQEDKAQSLNATVSVLKAQVDEKRYVDIGQNVWLLRGIPETTFKNAVAVLKEQGYKIYYPKVKQLGTNKETTLKVMVRPDVTGAEFRENQGNIKQIIDFSDDGGRSYFGILPPLSINPDRVSVIYKEQGGANADGVIYVRRGVPDVSLGDKTYAQVRILVGDGHYIKGMAMYKDNLPKGIDLAFNTIKSDTGNKLDALKEIKRTPTGEMDPDNPFGSVIRQIVVRDSNGQNFVTGYGKNVYDGTERVVSAMNLVNEEGGWGKWSKSLSTQVLSKQSPRLAKTQLDITYERFQKELSDIQNLTNPVVRKKLLQELSDSVDASSVHLKAAALKDQATHVILPINTMPPNQVYAPNYENGRTVVLIRYPHGGTFEIPELTVNNNHPEAKRLLGKAQDAIGIHFSVAERLSGADFDGDTVLVIPNDGPPAKRIKATAALEQLEGFDPRSQYRSYEGMPRMTERQKGMEMGKITNLISDMTVQGAGTDEIARAIKHAMVVIDAEKHHLNYKQSEIDNGIRSLKEKYQGGARSGTATLFTKAGSRVDVPNLKTRSAKEGGAIDPKTGKIVYDPNSAVTYVNKKGQTVTQTRRSVALAETSDAYTLIKGIPNKIEVVYADHSNRLKNLANDIRKELVTTSNVKYSPSAAKVYKKEVQELISHLRIAERNAPLERQAQIVANELLRLKKKANPGMTKDEEKKVKSQLLNEARNRTGAGKQRIQITKDQWNAIQAGAVSTARLEAILRNADMDVVKNFATPKVQTLMTSTAKSRAKAMFANGYTRAEVAKSLGVSLTTLDLAVQESEA